jgi:hypothetical protein
MAEKFTNVSVISIILLKEIIKNEENILTPVSQNIVIEEKWYKK